MAGVASRSSRPVRLFVSLAAVTLLLSASAAVPAQADTRPGGRATATARKEAAADRSGPLLAVVSLSKQRIRVYGRSGLLAQSRVSTGMAGHRTPAGVFSILQRRRYHRSNIYSNAPMPYMQRLTWSGIALHAGVVPGYPASHGCIRLPFPFAAELWRMAEVGTPVIVAPADPSAVPIEHARLPKPRHAPASPDDARLVAGGESLGHGPTLASAAGVTVTDAAEEPGLSAVRLLSPLQRARALKARAQADAAAATKAARLAARTEAATAAEARRAATTLRSAERALATARHRYERAAEALETKASERAVDALAAAQAALDAAGMMADEAHLLDVVRTEDAAGAAAAHVHAENSRRDAAAVLKAVRRVEKPISILVSRKAGRVYIRQAWTTIHEAPATFADGASLGTHVYLATGTGEDGEALNWLAVSLPPSARARSRMRSRARQSARADAESGPPAETAETAATVLDRFELPEATRRFIGDRLWAGATLIVSDNGISNETGEYTDFIVLTR